MKKIIALALSVLMILTCLVGCGEDAATSDLDNAIAFLDNMYQTGKKDEAMKLSSDKDVLSVVVIDGVSYNVEWTVEVTEGDKDAVKIAESETENCVKIDIPDLPEADILFTANATVKDEEDNTATASFKYKVVGIVIAGTDDTATILEDAYALAEGAKMDGEVTLTGKITSVDTPYDAGYKNLTVTIVIEGFDDKPIKCYRLAGEGADTLAVGDTITVTGIIANYKGTIEFEQGCVIKAISKADGTTTVTPNDTTSTPGGTTSTPGGITSTPTGTTSTPTGTTSTPSADKKPTSKTAAQIVAEAYALKNGESLPYIATLTGKVNNIPYPYTEDYGGQISVTISVEGKDIYCFKMKGTGVDKVAIGDTITVTGVIKNYNGTIEFAWDQASETEVTMNKRVAGSGSVATLTVVDNPVAGTAYKLGMVQKNANNTTYYLKGGIASQYYINTTALPTDAVDVYLEETSGGFYLYYLSGSTKTYINMVTVMGNDGKEHVNADLSSTAKTVYTFDATKKIPVSTATKNGEEGTYAIGTRNDKSYSTVGPVDVSYDGFHCQFYK